MALLIAIIIGTLVGGAAGTYKMAGFDALLIHIVAGIVGALLAAILYTLIGPGIVEGSLFSPAGAVASLFGAILAVLTLKGSQRLASK